MAALTEDVALSLHFINKYESVSPCTFLQCCQTLVFPILQKKILLILIFLILKEIAGCPISQLHLYIIFWELSVLPFF